MLPSCAYSTVVCPVLQYRQHWWQIGGVMGDFYTWLPQLSQPVASLVHTPSLPGAGLGGPNEGENHTAVLRDTSPKHLTPPLSEMLNWPHHFSHCSMPVQGRLLELVGQTKGSNVSTPTHCTVWHMWGGEWEVTLHEEIIVELLRCTHIRWHCMVFGVEVRRWGEY